MKVELSKDEAAILLTGLAVLSNMVITEHGMSSTEYKQVMDLMAKIGSELERE